MTRLATQLPNHPDLRVCTTPTNEYAETVAAHILTDSERPGKTVYRCSREDWPLQFRRWQKAADDLPEPMPEGHSMFVNPAGYGYVPLGNDDPEALRAAITSRVREMLRGWTDDLEEETREAIIRATVDAKMRGEDTGAAPFITALFAGL